LPAETNLPVERIALLTGFRSLSHLGSKFRRDTGMTPRSLSPRSSRFLISDARAGFSGRRARLELEPFTAFRFVRERPL
jgi:AraC-like DNA-binding protein